MKKALWIAMVGALAASVIAASAQEVLSANAVGYIKKTLPSNAKLVALSIPLNNMTEASNVFGRTSVAQEAPVNTTVFFWDELNQVWSGGSKSGKGWTAGISNRVIASGEAFFLKSSSTSTIPVEVTITGEVPDDSALSRIMMGSNNLAAVANPFPVDFKFGASTLARDASVNSTVFFWDTTNQVWSGGTKSGKGWTAGISNRIVLAAEGFFLKEVSNVTTWVESKPYTWP